MKIVVRLTILLLSVNSIYGVSWRPAEFPDLSGENSEEFDYGDGMKESQIGKFAKQPLLEFRIDARNVPCVNKTMHFCENVTNQAYLIDYVESMLAPKLAQNDTLKNYFNKTMALEQELGVRMLSTTDEMCNSIKRLIHPQLVMNVKRQWHFVVNTPSYQQPIVIEICQMEKNNECTCKTYHKHACVQEYTEAQLLGLDEDGQFEVVFYKYPSNCECKRRRFQNH